MATAASRRKGPHLKPGQCVMVDITRIKPDPRNEVRHPPRQIRKLKAALRRYGQQKPIVISRDFVCLAGHGVLQAAQELGWKVIECIVSNLTGARAALYRFSDNWITRFARMDEEIMSANIRAIEEKAGHVFDADELGLERDELERLREGGEAWHGRRLSLDAIGDYDPSKETFVIKIERVAKSEGPALAELLNSSLAQTGYEARLC